jgi:hypothetical protein
MHTGFEMSWDEARVFEFTAFGEFPEDFGGGEW